jgi:hypothetical protein
MKHTVSADTFLEFTNTVALPKLRVARDARWRRGYNFYAKLVGAIVAMHREGRDVASIDVEPLCKMDGSASCDERKMRIFPGMLDSYDAFMSRAGKATWFEPPRVAVDLGGINVEVEPELGLEIGGKPHVLLFDFGCAPIPQRKINMSIALLRMAFGSELPMAAFGVLKLPPGNLYNAATSTEDIPACWSVLRAEGAALKAFFEQFDQEGHAPWTPQAARSHGAAT